MPNTREKGKLSELIQAAKSKKQYDFLYGNIDDAIDMKSDEEYIADHLIANGVTVQQWIPVTERLPEDWKERVLVKVKDAKNIIGHPDMDTDRYMGERWVRWGHNVTHWMPLPEAPKGE